MCLSSAFQAFADVNGTGGGDIEQASDESYAARYHVFTENQGMRIYLINQKGETVSSFVDIVQYRPETIEQGLITQSNSGHETSAYYTSLYKAYKKYTGALKQDKSYLYLSGTKFDSKGGKFNSNLSGTTLKGGKMYTYTELGAFIDAYYQAQFNAPSPINQQNPFALPIKRNMSTMQLEGQGEILKQQMDLSVGDKNMLGFLLNLKLPVWDEKGVLVTDSLEPIIQYKNQDDKIESQNLDNIVDVAREKGYWVAIEPIHWAVLEIHWPTCPNPSLRGGDLQAFACSTKVVYGTESTVYNYFYTDASTYWKDKNYPINEMFPSWCWGLGKYAFQLKQNDTELGLSTIPEGWDRVTNVVDLETLAKTSRTIGYGLMLMKTEPQQNNGLNVVKVFRENNSIIDIKQSSTTHTKTYNVDEEEGFSYTESKKDDDLPLIPDSWEQVDGDPSPDTKITINEDTKTVYILYEKINTNSNLKPIMLYSNELSYNYNLSDFTNNQSLFSIYDTIPKAPGTRPDCGRHSCGDEDCSGNHMCNSDNKYLSDNSYIISVKDNFNYNSGTTFIKDYVLDSSTTSITGEASWDGGTSENIEPNANFLLYRQKDKDLITLYPNKNSLDLSSLGITKSSYKPFNTRVEQEATKEKYFTNTFQPHFEYSDSRDTGLTWNWDRSGSYGSHSESGAYDTQTAKGPEDANLYYSQPSNTRFNYFLGQANKGLDEAQIVLDTDFNNLYTANQYSIVKSSLLNFYPYYEMIYREIGDNSNIQSVYATSENLSTIKVFNNLQIGVKKKFSPNLNLSSTQWSTHKRSLSFLQNQKISDKKSILPGGAILDLDTGKSGDTELRIKLFISCLPDEMVKTVQEGFKTSETEARQQIEAYKQEVYKTLEGYYIQQAVKTGFEGKFKDFLKDYEVVEGGKKIKLNNKSFTTHKDAKYYLKEGSKDATRANLDVLNLHESYVVYTIKSDTKGNITLLKDGEIFATLSNTKPISDLLKNQEIQLLDENTKLISNFYKALDRQGGKDRTGKPWYNEGYDGVSVIVADLRYSLGFKSPSSLRSIVLDTLLTGKAENKKDLYNFDDSTLDEKLRTSCFITSQTSAAINSNKSGYLGSFKAKDDALSLDTYISKPEVLFYSKLFYIPNANVSDLN